MVKVQMILALLCAKCRLYPHTLTPEPYVVVPFIGTDKALFSILELLLSIWVIQCFDCWSAAIKNEQNLLICHETCKDTDE